MKKAELFFLSWKAISEKNIKKLTTSSQSHHSHIIYSYTVQLQARQKIQLFFYLIFQSNLYSHKCENKTICFEKLRF